jgi:hypothetical protein
MFILLSHFGATCRSQDISIELRLKPYSFETQIQISFISFKKKKKSFKMFNILYSRTKTWIGPFDPHLLGAKVFLVQLSIK